jgi:hypothetical protein
MSHDVACMAVVFVGTCLTEGGGDAMWVAIFFIKQYNGAGTLKWGFDRTSPMLSFEYGLMGLWPAVTIVSWSLDPLPDQIWNYNMSGRHSAGLGSYSTTG